MNFFERQHQVRRLSVRLVLLFALAVAGIVITIDLVVVVLAGGFGGQPVGSVIGIVLMTTAAVLALIGLSSLFRAISLRSGGGGKVARSLGGRPVPPDTRDPQLRRLRNVVEEIAIASGTPVPELYVLEGEAGINAFAAGWSPSDAAVAVTRGALDRLNRDELQGVIAHEFSHVVNGDMRLNIKLMGLLFGILVLYFVGSILARVRGGQRNPLPLVGLALIGCGLIGIFVGRIIKAAVSRQREYLADASAVQFTRQTAGLTGALKKIAGLPTGSKLRNAKAEDVSHMLFGSVQRFSNLFATHPPLFKRIHALDPSVSVAELEQLQRRWAESPPVGMAEDEALGLASGSGRPPAAAPAGGRVAAGGPIPAAPEVVVAAVGAPAEVAQQRAEGILDRIPDELLDRARSRETVLPLLLGLLLSAHPEVRVRQHVVLAERHGQAVADAAWREAGGLTRLDPMLRLPLAEVAFPAVREAPRPRQDALMATVQALIRADGRLSVSEYCLSRLLYEELYELGHRHPAWGRRRYSLSASRDAGGMLLATLAHAGHTDAATAEAAFRAGTAHLFPGQRLPYAPPEQGVAALETAWPALDGLNPADKQVLVEAMVAVIGHDGQLTVEEVELLRTICALLHCPLPPLAEVGPPAADGAGPARDDPPPRHDPASTHP
jgi:Zn-dependent protease with chaperone function